MVTRTAHLSTVVALLLQDLHAAFTEVLLGVLTEVHCVDVENYSSPSRLSTSATRHSWHHPINENWPYKSEDQYRS
jgi:hypothetical protein